MSKLIDLQEQTIERHWKEVDEGVSTILENMQVQETWALDDHDDLLSEIIAWAGNLTEKRLEHIVEQKPDALIRIFAFMRSKRSLFLSHEIEKNFPGVIAELLLESLDKIEGGVNDTRPQRILRDRLVALFRVDLLERIFSVERCQKIKEAIRSTSEISGRIYE